MTQLPYLRKSKFLLLFLLLSLLFVSTSLVVSAAAHDNDIWWGQLGHNSRDPLYRYPQGAVPTNTAVTLRLRAADGDLTSVDVRIWNDRENYEQLIPMTRVAGGVQLPNDAEVYEFWEAVMPVSSLPTVYWYRFILRDGTRTVYYEDDGGRTGGWGQTFDNSPDNSYQLTIYDAAFQTPDWVKNAVIYQIFVDRFRDGVAGNHTPAGSFFYGNFDTVYRSNDPEGDWNTQICDPRNALGTNVCNGIYSQNFYGGDLQGVIQQLPYLQSLGVTALYLNPIFESPSNHKYDTTDFSKIDDNFGTLADFQQLTSTAESLGIRVILDGVFNHSSSDSIYFDRYSRYDGLGNPTTLGVNDASGACESLASGAVGWYTFFPYAGAGSAPCSDNRDYPKWFGIFDSLPVYQHDFPAVRDYFINNGVNSIGPYWMQWADGWRLDVAPEVDHGTINDPGDNYWENFRTAVRAVNPDTYIVGEEWGNPTSWTIGGEWDATMNYQFSSATLSFWRDTTFTDNDFNSGSSAGTLNPLGPSGYNERILNLEERYAPEAFYAMMNLFGSHDTNRVLFLLDHNTGTNNTAQYYNPNYDWSDALTRLRGAVLVQMTMPGAPTIYYGDEVGTVNPPSFDGSSWQDDPYNRVPYPWLDETGTPYYAHMQDATAQNALRTYYSALTGIRNSNAALRTGSFDPLVTNDAQGVYVYGRQMSDDSNSAIIAVNKTSTVQVATFNVAGYVPAGEALTDALTNTVVNVASNGDVSVNLPARGGVVLVRGSFVRPATVTDLNATGSANQVNLSWSAAANADTYDVYRSRLSHGGYAYLGSTSSTNYVDTTAQNATRYYYVVVSKNSVNLLTSDQSNEANATPALTIGWANLQWPPSISYTLSATQRTDNIFGQVWIDGFTNQPGATPGLMAQVGYGANTNPSGAGWTWENMTFNENKGNNDEYMGSLKPTQVGKFCYTTRYSTDGGATWYYAVGGPDQPHNDPMCPGPFGVMNVNAGNDTTAPSAPTNLTLVDVTSTSVSLAWDAHPNADGDLFGFKVWRENVASPGYSVVATLNDPAATSYVDTNATGGLTYNYYVTAFDTSTNASAPSNSVNVTVEFRQVAVTFRVTVPAFTPGLYPVHIVGPFNGWNPGGTPMTQSATDPNVWEITLDILDGTNFEHKFTRGSWDRVEKTANGYDEVPNRFVLIDYGTSGTQVIETNVANWRDPIVTASSPANNALVGSTTVITFSWNKWMPTPPGGVSIVGPSGAVAGSLVFDEPSLTHTFTPNTALEPGLYTLSITGAASGGDTQQVPFSSSFTVEGAATATPTETPTSTDTPTDVPTETPTSTDTPTDVPTETPTSTDTPTDVPTETPTSTDTPTDVPTETPTSTDTPTEVPTETPTATPTTAPTNNVESRVWNDRNGNGWQEEGEEGVNGVLVEVLDSNRNPLNPAVTTFTMGDGLATFALPQGTYYMRYTLPAGTAFTRSNRGNDNADSDANTGSGLSPSFRITATTGVMSNLDAGLWLPGTLEAFVWDDQDGDGVQEEGEPGVAGIAVQLLDSGTSAVLAETTTNGDGLATFTNVPADRSLRLKFIKPDGTAFTRSNRGNDNTDSDANTGTGLGPSFRADRGSQVFDHMDAGLWLPGSLEAFVWDDQDGDGVQEEGEPGVAGIAVQLLDSGTSAVLAETTTNGDGLATFTNVPADRSLRLKFIKPDGTAFTRSNRGNDNTDSDANTGTGLGPSFRADRGSQVFDHMDAGLWLLGTVQSFVWQDTDEDGTQDEGEPGMAGVMVKLLDSDTSDVLAEVQTDEDGIATFTNVPADRSLRLEFFSPEGMAFTRSNRGNEATDSDANTGTGLGPSFRADRGSQVFDHMDAGLHAE